MGIFDMEILGEDDLDDFAQYTNDLVYFEGSLID
jgi:hypothetical protein